MEKIEAYLLECLQKYGITLEKQQAEQFQRYMELLLEWNEKMNLTAIKEPRDVVVKHFVDSLLLGSSVGIKENASCVDVGTGAGFPGIPLKIFRPDISLTLLDSLNKRLVFLAEVLKELSLKAEIIHERAEVAGTKKELREKFDLVTARAVAPLNILCEYCLPFVKPGGYFAAMKGPEVEKELEEAENAIGLLGGAWKETKKFELPDGSGRSIVMIEKVRHLSDKYPRHGSKISKSPL